MNSLLYEYQELHNEYVAAFQARNNAEYRLDKYRDKLSKLVTYCRNGSIISLNYGKDEYELTKNKDKSFKVKKNGKVIKKDNQDTVTELRTSIVLEELYGWLGYGMKA